MTYTFNKLILQNQRTVQLELERNKAELRAFQAQINPHFMYNTFSSIKWMNKAGKKEQVDQMIDLLSDLFRFGINEENALIPVQEEVRHAQAYVNIQKIRFADQLTCRFDVSPEAEDILVPKLILQPLIENSIYHGIRELEDFHGIIEIQIHLDGAALLLCVTDNGKGFSPERLAEIKSRMDSPQPGAASGIGLLNVYRRLQLHYGRRFAMRIASEPYRKTEVSIRLDLVLPKK